MKQQQHDMDNMEVRSFGERMLLRNTQGNSFQGLSHPSELTRKNRITSSFPVICYYITAADQGCHCIVLSRGDDHALPHQFKHPLSVRPTTKYRLYRCEAFWSPCYCQVLFLWTTTINLRLWVDLSASTKRSLGQQDILSSNGWSCQAPFLPSGKQLSTLRLFYWWMITVTFIISAIAVLFKPPSNGFCLSCACTSALDDCLEVDVLTCAIVFLKTWFICNAWCIYGANQEGRLIATASDMEKFSLQWIWIKRDDPFVKHRWKL